VENVWKRGVKWGWCTRERRGLWSLQNMATWAAGSESYPKPGATCSVPTRDLCCQWYDQTAGRICTEKNGEGISNSKAKTQRR